MAKRPHLPTLITLSEVLKADIADGRVTPAQAREVRKQKRLFDAHRKSIESKHRGKHVAYAGGAKYVGDSIEEIISKIDAVNPKHLFYSEQIV